MTRPTTALLAILIAASLPGVVGARADTIAHWDFTTARPGDYTNIAPDTSAAGTDASTLVWINEAPGAQRPIGVVVAPLSGNRLTAGKAQGTFDGRAYEIPTIATAFSPISKGGPRPRGASSLEFTVKPASGITLALSGFSFSLGYTTSHSSIKNYRSPCASLFVSTDGGKTFVKIGVTEYLRTGDASFFDRKAGYALRENIVFPAANFEKAGLGKNKPLAAGATALFRLAIGEDSESNLTTRRFIVDDIRLTGDVIQGGSGSSAVAQTPMMPATFAVTVDVSAINPIGDINPDIYGQYIEHVQMKDECIYPAIWDDTSPLSDAAGLRRDVIAGARELGVPVIRWPGGCFADVYHWEDAIGPRATRKTLPNIHWKGTEPNTFGTDEFLNWSGQIGSKPYININLGSGTLDEALRWLEYCNGGDNTPQGKRRAANGHPAPYQVPLWGIGNETWAHWETGQMDAKTYAKTLAKWASAFRKNDPSIKILAVGSNSGDDHAWDAEVVTKAGHLIDYLTLHHYGRSTDYTGAEFETVACLQPAEYDYCIRRMLHHIDTAARGAGLKNTINISLDEWNIRHYDGKKLLRKDPRNLQDAVFASGVLNVLLRNSPRVAMANYVFLVNGHAPLLVNKDGVVKTPLFYIFQQYARWMHGRALTVTTTGPSVSLPAPRKPNPAVPAPATVAVLDTAAALAADGSITLALVNRHRDDSARASLVLPEGYAPAEVWTLSHDDLYAQNTFDAPDKVTPVVKKIQARVKREKEQTQTASTVKKMTAGWVCPPHSVTLIRCLKQ